MNVADKIPTMDDKALVVLKANASRIQGEGGVKSEAAAQLLPLIEAELAKRQSEKPPRVSRPRRAAAAPAEA